MRLGRYRRVAAFGGVYSNHLALAEAVRDARSRGAEAILCLGDLGAFGPNPDRVFPILRGEEIPVLRGNYDDSIARGLDDCQCGYTDPRDNHYARISYRYTFENTSPENRRWMADLPHAIRLELGELRVLACHGSPRQMNEFLWESTTPTHFLEKLARDHDCDVILGTHTGIHWKRSFRAPSLVGEVEGEEGERRAGGSGTERGGSRARGDARTSPRVTAHPEPDVARGWYVNVGALGRPANDGRTDVWYAMLEARGADLEVEFVPVAYDHEALAREMEEEGLPDEFVETILTGWWTTCLEILPGKERARGRW